MPTATLDFDPLLPVTVGVLISSRESGGEYTVCDLQITGSVEVPPHRHSYEDQWYQVLSGQFRFDIGGNTVSAGPGTTVTVPRQTAARISCSEPGRLLIVARPGGLDLFFADAHSATAARLEPLQPTLEKHGIVPA